jgi:hypothetical protein
MTLKGRKMVINRKVEFKTQTRDDNCTSACLAMILHKDVDVVTAEFQDLFFAGKTTPADYLRKHDRIVRAFSSLERVMLFGHVYLLCVPSLNKEATLHSIISDTLDDVVEIYDPRRGTGHKYYVYEDSEDPLAVRMKGFVIDLEII